VLDKMLELEFITKADYDASHNKPLKLDNSQKNNLEAKINNYFIDALIDQVISDLSQKYNCSEDIASTMLYNGGYKIYSTVDPRIQGIMESVYQNPYKYFNAKGKNIDGDTVNIQSAMTILDYSGHIVGIVGGVGEKNVNRGLNRAISAPRQPGSTMKPIGVYALAIEKDLVHYTSKVLDKPIDNYYPDGKKGPKEWYGYYKGNISLNYALRKSANTIPVRLLKEVGIEDSYNFLTQKLKFKYITEADKNLSSLALGGCQYGITTTESASAFAIFGNNGLFFKPTTYHKIEKMNGEVVLEADTKGTQVISPATATIMNHLLQEVVYGSEGTGTRIAGYSSMKAYAKTGTSSEANDSWMVAGTPYYVGSVWCGFDMPQKISITSAAANAWKEIMRQIHKGLEKKTFTDSKDVFKKGSGYYKKGSNPTNIQYSSGESSKNESSSSTSSTSSVASSPPNQVVSSTPATQNNTTSSSTSSSDPSNNTTSQPSKPVEPGNDSNGTPSTPQVPTAPESSSTPTNTPVEPPVVETPTAPEETVTPTE